MILLWVCCLRKAHTIRNAHGCWVLATPQLHNATNPISAGVMQGEKQHPVFMAMLLHNIPHQGGSGMYLIEAISVGQK